MEGEKDRWRKGERKLDCRQVVFLGGQFCREEGSDGNASARGRRDHTCSKKREHRIERTYNGTAIKKKPRTLDADKRKMQKNSKPGEC